MSRLIEFRGLATNGEFVYGSLVSNCVGLASGVGQNTKTWIVTSAFGNGGWFNIRGRQYVKPETVGQFTGLLDCNGFKIFEGDIVCDHNDIGEVEYSDNKAAFKVRYHNGFAKWFIDYSLKGERESIEVIGNIHQNSELLK